MKEPVVVEEQAYRKGEGVFSEWESSVQWTVSHESEAAVAEAIESSGARIAVLGAARYGSALYRSLARNAGGKPTLIARFGVGFDGINLELCRKDGIFVTNTPGTLDQSVAEHAVALLLALARNVPLLDRELRSGSYQPVTGFELRGKALGIAGFGRIGRKTALIASRGFGMKIHAFDILTIEEQAARENASVREVQDRYAIEGYHTDFSAFVRSARIISIHLPVTAATRGYLSRERLALLGDGTLLVNTGRGALVDERALYEALASGKVGGAALDVFGEEPYRPAGPDCDLRALPNVVLTPHVASNTTEANANMANAVMENVRSFLAGSFGSLTRVI
jgi:lactate dehydrogenase-like 2-hydroxyacid dehydrogenase